MNNCFIRNLLIFIVILYSCSNPGSDKNIESQSDIFFAKGVTPAAANLKPPLVTLLDTCQKPRVITVPAKAVRSSVVQSNDGLKKIELWPPEVTSLDKKQGIGFFTTYTTDQGLTVDAIISFCIDHTGNMWLGTGGGGVDRYDGKSFKNFSYADGLGDDIVHDILEDRAGNIWFCTVAGLTRYDGTKLTNFGRSEGLPDDDVRAVIQDKRGVFWIGTLGGLSRYNPLEKKTGNNLFTNFTTADGLVNKNVRSILEDKDGKLWLGTDGGLSCFEEEKRTKRQTGFTNYTTLQGLPVNRITSVAEDNDGKLWIGTTGGGVSCFNGKSFTTFGTKQGLADNVVWCVYKDRGGNMWIGTDGGVSLYDPGKEGISGKSFINYTTAQGLTCNIVISMIEDPAGNLWFGTYGGGMSRFDGQSFRTYTSSDGILEINDIRGIIEDRKGNLWFGTGGGVSRYDGKQVTNFTVAQGLPDKLVYCVTEDKAGNIWFGTHGGACRFNGTTFTIYSTLQGLINDTIEGILVDTRGNVWFATVKGASRYDGKSFTNFTTDQGLAWNDIFGLCEDSTGNIWFGTRRGLSRYNGHSFSNYTFESGLECDMITTMLTDKKGNLWIGPYNGGLYRFDGKCFKKFGSREGLYDEVTYGLTEDKEGVIWTGTNHGICSLRFSIPSGGKGIGDSITGAGNISCTNQEITKYSLCVEMYNSKTGYPVKDVNGNGQTGALLCDSKGIIWIGSGSVKSLLVRFDPKEIHRNLNTPKVMIQSILVNEQNICWDFLKEKERNEKSRRIKEDDKSLRFRERMTYGKFLTPSEREVIRMKFSGIEFDSITPFYPIPLHLVLPYKFNQIAFEYAAIESVRPRFVNYQYILEGYDKQWSPLTNKTSVSFGNIFEGTYTFRLKAQSPDGVWSNPVSYSFRVLPPWYRTRIAYLLYLGSGILGIWLFISWRLRRLKKEKKVLEQKVDERTLQLKNEKKISDDLLLNILPAEVAEELKQNGSSKARHFDCVTVMFTDFKDFTEIAGKLSPAELVAEIDTCFKAFDNIIGKYNIEKIKTIGDSYMCAGGLPYSNKTNATDVIKAAMEIQAFMNNHAQNNKAEGKEIFKIRTGIHSGPVVAGIVGVKKFAYDIWGDTVNIASRMESSGEAGKINISGATYQFVKNKFNCIYRGKIEAKNIGMIDMYFVEDAKPQS